MLRITLAVAASFLTMLVLVFATQMAMLRYLFHSTSRADSDLLPPAYLLAYGAIRVVYAVIAGCMCAALGKKHEAPTILGALMLGMAIGNVMMTSPDEPLWFAVMVPLVGAVVATVAGYRWLGRLPESAN